MAPFRRVKKPGAAKGPATVPIIPGVAILPEYWLHWQLPEDAGDSISDKAEEAEEPEAAEVVTGDLV